jgi:hypothetical protein
MAAWGPKPFDNELSNDYILSLVNANIHAVILEPVDRNTQYLKHKLAYYYDRFRAAIELMILFETNGVFKFAKGYYDLAIEKMISIYRDEQWANSWDNETKSKSTNYINDLNRQIEILKELRDKARE